MDFKPVIRIGEEIDLKMGAQWIKCKCVDICGIPGFPSGVWLKDQQHASYILEILDEKIKDCYPHGKVSVTALQIHGRVKREPNNIIKDIL